MYRTQILLEPEQHRILTEIARQEKRSLSELIREMVDKLVVERRQSALVTAAQTLLADYQTDPELTAFQVLDGEDFHA
jgi:predicted DNA-binding ribbon-helix-helix protein